ncbi:unnamed protein product [Amoebophrya sp. A120]|nr:unnamed protein product [Amoebophrya sp. A120]|eukprot:GSA120T00013359001.1
MGAGSSRPDGESDILHLELNSYEITASQKSHPPVSITGKVNIILDPDASEIKELRKLIERDPTALQLFIAFHGIETLQTANGSTDATNTIINLEHKVDYDFGNLLLVNKQNKNRRKTHYATKGNTNVEKYSIPFSFPLPQNQILPGSTFFSSVEQGITKAAIEYKASVELRGPVNGTSRATQVVGGSSTAQTDKSGNVTYEKAAVPINVHEKLPVKLLKPVAAGRSSSAGGDKADFTNPVYRNTVLALTQDGKTANTVFDEDDMVGKPLGRDLVEASEHKQTCCSRTFFCCAGRNNTNAQNAAIKTKKQIEKENTVVLEFTKVLNPIKQGDSILLEVQILMDGNADRKQQGTSNKGAEEAKPLLGKNKNGPKKRLPKIQMEVWRLITIFQPETKNVIRNQEVIFRDEFPETEVFNNMREEVLLKLNLFQDNQNAGDDTTTAAQKKNKKNASAQPTGASQHNFSESVPPSSASGKLVQIEYQIVAKTIDQAAFAASKGKELQTKLLPANEKQLSAYLWQFPCVIVPRRMAKGSKLSDQAEQLESILLPAAIFHQQGHMITSAMPGFDGMASDFNSVAADDLYDYGKMGTTMNNYGYDSENGVPLSAAQAFDIALLQGHNQEIMSGFYESVDTGLPRTKSYRNDQNSISGARQISGGSTSNSPLAGNLPATKRTSGKTTQNISVNAGLYQSSPNNSPKQQSNNSSRKNSKQNVIAATAAAVPAPTTTGRNSNSRILDVRGPQNLPKKPQAYANQMIESAEFGTPTSVLGSLQSYSYPDANYSDGMVNLNSSLQTGHFGADAQSNLPLGRQGRNSEEEMFPFVPTANNLAVSSSSGRGGTSRKLKAALDNDKQPQGKISRGNTNTTTGAKTTSRNSAAMNNLKSKDSSQNEPISGYQDIIADDDDMLDLALISRGETIGSSSRNDGSRGTDVDGGGENTSADILLSDILTRATGDLLANEPQYKENLEKNYAKVSRDKLKMVDFRIDDEVKDLIGNVKKTPTSKAGTNFERKHSSLRVLGVEPIRKYDEMIQSVRKSHVW